MNCPLCSAPMSPNAILCLTHWARVPMAYQRQVLVRRNQVARALSGANPMLLAKAAKLYRQACETAVESVRERASA